MQEVSEAEVAVFKKKVEKLSKYKGRGTELISQYIPPNTDRGSVMGTLTEEISQSSNIKSPQTRKNVQGALRKIINFLKQIDFRIPKTGLVVFAGNVSEAEGRTDIRLFTVRPPAELKTKLYWCDSEFHLAPLKEMIKPREVYGLVTIDKNESVIATISGKKYEIAGHFSSGVAGKTRAGGQSAKRFEHLREEATQEFFKRISEKVDQIFLPYGDKLAGVIVAGPGMTKNYFLEKGEIDHRIKSKIIGQIDTSYTDESGVREALQKSGELLKDTDIMREKELVSNFFGEAAKGALATYGEKEIEEALDLGKVSEVLISEDLEWVVFKVKCTSCGKEKIIKKKAPPFELAKADCECGSKYEVLEEIDYTDYLLEKAQSTGADVRLVSTDTPEGEQFFKAFGGIGAMLRYK